MASCCGELQIQYIDILEVNVLRDIMRTTYQFALEIDQMIDPCHNKLELNKPKTTLSSLKAWPSSRTAR